VFEGDEVIVEDDSLTKVRQRLLFDQRVKLKPAIVTLPEGYRTDWDSSLIGKSLLLYLLNVRKLSRSTILRYEIGYTLKGNYAGGIVLPVYMERKLRFWQVRRVMLSGKNVPKYDSPKVERSDVLYGYDDIATDHVTIVEGIFDKLAIGDSCVALLGKTITEQQLARLAAKAVNSVTVLLDGNAWKQATEAARFIAKNLWCVRQVSAIRLPFSEDPGRMGRSVFDNPLETLKIRP